jgi:hypothetical protein
MCPHCHKSISRQMHTMNKDHHHHSDMCPYCNIPINNNCGNDDQLSYITQYPSKCKSCKKPLCHKCNKCSFCYHLTNYNIHNNLNLSLLPSPKINKINDVLDDVSDDILYEQNPIIKETLRLKSPLIHDDKYSVYSYSEVSSFQDPSSISLHSGKFPKISTISNDGQSNIIPNMALSQPITKKSYRIGLSQLEPNEIITVNPRNTIQTLFTKPIKRIHSHSSHHPTLNGDDIIITDIIPSDKIMNKQYSIYNNNSLKRNNDTLYNRSPYHIYTVKLRPSSSHRGIPTSNKSKKHSITRKNSNKIKSKTRTRTRTHSKSKTRKTKTCSTTSNNKYRFTVKKKPTSSKPKSKMTKRRL